MKFGSLFAGIGGIDLGLERAGISCAWQVEIDDYATRVLAKHWPDVPKFRDVRSVGAHNLPAVDCICGGFPCQDISSAGQRAGITGTRSGLWAEFARIICELRPRYVLVENVAALLHRGIDRVLGDLVALGFDAEWHCIPAAAFGAPHIRDRVYIVAYADCAEWRAQPEGRHVADWNDTGRQEAPGRLAAHGQDGGTGILADAECGVSTAGGKRAGWEAGTNTYWSGAGSDVADAKRDRWQQGTEVFWTRQPITTAVSQDVSDADSQRRDGRRRVFPPTFPARFADPEREHAWRIEPDVGRVAHGVPARVDRLRGLGNAVVPQAAEYVGRLIMEHAHAERTTP